MFIVTALALLAVMVLLLLRGVKGPTVYDRILAVNAFGTVTVLLIAVHGFFDGRPDFLDISLVYALINFISTIAVTKYVTVAHLGMPLDGKPWSDV